MNERILELAQQANATELSYGYYRGEKKPENAVAFHSVDLEKFAELIVRECVGVVDDAVNYREPASTYVGKIKQHFGVEE